MHGTACTRQERRLAQYVGAGACMVCWHLPPPPIRADTDGYKRGQTSSVSWGLHVHCAYCLHAHRVPTHPTSDCEVGNPEH